MDRINHVAVIVAVIVHQVLGFLWYSVAPFAATRLEALGKSPEKRNAVDPAALAMDIAGWFLASYLIAWLIQKTNSDRLSAAPSWVFFYGSD